MIFMAAIAIKLTSLTANPPLPVLLTNDSDGRHKFKQKRILLPASGNDGYVEP
jgi:hypothetical protein